MKWSTAWTGGPVHVRSGERRAGREVLRHNPHDVIRIARLPDYGLRVRQLRSRIHRCDNNDGNVARGIARGKFLEHRPPINLRQHEIEQNQVGLIVFDRPQRRQSVSGTHHR
jgi:hypothetical protein